VALFIGAIIFSPVIVWNWQHQWVSFVYQSQHGFSPDRQHVGSKLLEYLGGQALVITPGIFLTFIFYSMKGFYLSVRERIPEYLYLVFLSWPLLAFFAFSTAVGDLAEANWPAPAYVTGFLLMWAVYCRASGKRKDATRVWLYAALGLAVAINGLVHVHLFRPVIPLPPHKDVTNQFHGWRDLGEEIDFLIGQHPHSDGYFLVAEWGTALGEAVFYSKKIDIGINFTRLERYIFLGDTGHLRGKNALILLRNVDESILRRYQPCFQSLTLIGSHKPRYRDEIIKASSFYIVLGQEYRGGGPQFNKGKTSPYRFLLCGNS